MRVVLILPLAALLVGCTASRPIDSVALMKRMAEKHSLLQSFEDDGTIEDIQVDDGETNRPDELPTPIGV